MNLSDFGILSDNSYIMCFTTKSFFTENKAQPFQGYSFSNKRKMLVFRKTEILAVRELPYVFLVKVYFQAPFFCVVG